MLITDTSVWIEFLRGSGSPHAKRMRQAIGDQEVIVVEPIRSQIDVLIAAVAIRLDVPVLHHHRDYEHIARHCALRTVEM